MSKKKEIPKEHYDKAEQEISQVELDKKMLAAHDVTDKEILDTKFYIINLQKGHPDIGKKDTDTAWYTAVLQGKTPLHRTTYLVHEVLEQRALKKRGIDLVKHPRKEAQRILEEEHYNAHLAALFNEFEYLRERLKDKMNWQDIIPEYFKDQEQRELRNYFDIKGEAIEREIEHLNKKEKQKLSFEKLIEKYWLEEEIEEINSDVFETLRKKLKKKFKKKK